LSHEVSAIEIAQKQRHAYLLGKVRQNQPLSRAEVEELKRYEMARKKTKKKPRTPPADGKRRRTVSLAEVRHLGLECENLTEAAVLFSGPGDLVALIAKRDNVRAAWERGRLLRKVSQLAATTVTVSAAAKEMGVTGPELRQLLDTDTEVADLWNENRRQLRMKLNAVMVEQAGAGKPNAMRYVENFLRSEKSPTGFDYEHVPIKVMEAITGKVRQTLAAWTRDAGLPRNPDCTYNLSEFVRWFEAATKAQAKSGKREDRLRVANAAMKELDYRKAQAHVLDRQAVENGLVARVQNLLAYVENHLPATAADCEGKAAAAIEQRLRRFVEGLREQMTEVPTELRLDEATAAEFKAFLGRLETPPAAALGEREERDG